MNMNKWLVLIGTVLLVWTITTSVVVYELDSFKTVLGTVQIFFWNAELFISATLGFFILMIGLLSEDK